jgi:hypothetical protein
MSFWESHGAESTAITRTPPAETLWEHLMGRDLSTISPTVVALGHRPAHSAVLFDPDIETRLPGEKSAVVGAKRGGIPDSKYCTI